MAKRQKSNNGSYTTAWELEIRPSDTIIMEGSMETEKPVRLSGLTSAECPFCHGTYVEVDESRLVEVLNHHYLLHEDWKNRPSDTITVERKKADAAI